MTRSRGAAVLIAITIALSSLAASEQGRQSASRAVIKLLGTFAGAVAMDTAKDVSKEYLLDWMKRARVEPAATQPTEDREKDYGYQFVLQWNDPRQATVTYSGVLTMLGASGDFRVTMYYGGRPAAVVAQFMEARPAPNRPGDVELYPKSAVFEQRASADINYAPDTFWLTQLPSGEWTIRDTCDGNACASVVAVSARLLVADR